MYRVLFIPACQINNDHHYYYYTLTQQTFVYAVKHVQILSVYSSPKTMTTAVFCGVLYILRSSACLIPRCFIALLNAKVQAQIFGIKVLVN